MSHSVDERYDIYEERERRARAQHICSACKEPIAEGHRYVAIFLVFDGDTEYLKRCLRCQEIHEHLRAMDPGELWPDEKLNCGEEYEEHWGRPPPDEIARLAFMSREEAQEAL